MDEIAIGQLIMGLFGGLAIFLFGMEQMTDALKSVAGAGMSRILGKLTSNRFTAAITGAFVTAVIQSSSVTTVLVVGFISAGLMSLQQSVGVIMGANVGTTITAQIIAFKVTEYALALVAIGFACTFFTKRQRWKLYGAMIMGLGMIFLGMGLMSEATKPLRTFEPFIELMQRMDRAYLAILVSAGFTALVQSSSATTGIVIVLASQGFISLEAGIALAFGANIGTCVTAVLAALGKPREAAQAAGVHLFFNILGVLIWLPFIGALAMVVTRISPSSPDLEGAARLAAETPRQIANAHTLFNIANTILFIWFTKPIALLVTKVLPVKSVPIPREARPKYIQDAFLETPGIALDKLRLEIIRLGEHVSEVGIEIGHATASGTAEDFERGVYKERNNQKLFEAITEYIRRLSTMSLSRSESRRVAALTAIAAHIQNVGETNAVNLVAIGRERLQSGAAFGDETVTRMNELVRRMRDAFDLAIDSLERPALAHEVIAMKSEIQQLAAGITEHLAARLIADDPNRALLFRLESQAVEIIQREYYFAKKIAKTVVTEIEASFEDPAIINELEDLQADMKSDALSS